MQLCLLGGIMIIKKKNIAEIKRCYATTNLNIDGQEKFVFASEDPNEGCFLFNANSFEKENTLWTSPGGCMCMVQIPGKQNEILAIQEFYLKENPSKAKVVWGKQINSQWIFKDVIKIPYIHRFDILSINNQNYFVGATIASYKESKNDWSHPGQIFIAEIPDDLSKGLELISIKDGLFRNHGFYKHESNGKSCIYIGSDEGITLVEAPEATNKKWKINTIIKEKVSEISIIDIDNDGEEEIMTIEPFHGNKIKIYKKINENYQVIYEYPNNIDFAHALASGKISGKNTFVAGVRRNDSELFMVQENNGELITTIIDKDIGPANIKIINQKNRDLILSANHSDNKAAIYIVQ